MAKIDLEKEVKKRIIAGGKKSNLNYYNINIKKMKVRTGAIRYTKQNIKELSPKVVDTIKLSPNCTNLVQEASYQYTQERSHSLTWKLGATYSYESDVTAQIDLGINVGGSTKRSFSLTGELSGTDTNKESKTFTMSAKVPPCSSLEMPIRITETEIDVEFEIDVVVSGSGTAMLDIPWWVDSEVHIIIYEKFTIRGSIKGIKSSTFQGGWIPKKATCPQGPCNKKIAKIKLSDVKVQAKGIGDDWKFSVNVGGTHRPGTLSSIKGTTYKVICEGERMEIPVHVDIVEEDPKYNDYGSGSGVIIIEPIKEKGQSIIKGSARAFNADKGSASFDFVFDWTVE